MYYVVRCKESRYVCLCYRSSVVGMIFPMIDPSFFYAVRSLPLILTECLSSGGSPDTDI